MITLKYFIRLLNNHLPKPKVSPKLCRNSNTITMSANAWPDNFRPGIRFSSGSDL